MKLWLIAQDSNGGYDTYDSAVVAAETEEIARNMHPNGHIFTDDPNIFAGPYSSWAHPDFVTAVYIGEAAEGTSQGPICSSFNAA